MQHKLARMSPTLPEDQRLHGLSPKAYEHPADRAATAALAAIPMLDLVVRKLIEFGYERALRQLFLAGSVRLGEDQLPQTWADWNAVTARLDLPDRYDLFLTQYPIVNAAAIGSGKPMVVLNSRTIELLEDPEIRTVLGHEAGHILSDHVLYRTALMILLSMSGVGRLPMLAGLPLLAVKLALLEWFRAAELSCDRAATLVNRDPLTTCRTLMVLAGGAASRKLNLDAFVKQAQEYRDWESGWDRLNRMQSELFTTHHFPVRRVHELMTWVQSGDYDRILSGEYPRRGQAADARKEAADATEFYAERFRSIFRTAGAGVENAGDKVAEAAEKVSEWIRGRGDGGEGGNGGGSEPPTRP
jgi:Zn-dependent protease with chaperone function